MKPSAGVVIFLMIVISLHPGESYNLTLVCKNESVSQSPFPCGQPQCGQYCAKKYYQGWGKCKDDDRFICQCFHICYKDINTTTTIIQADINASPPASARVGDPK